MGEPTTSTTRRPRVVIPSTERNMTTTVREMANNFVMLSVSDDKAMHQVLYTSVMTFLIRGIELGTRLGFTDEDLKAMFNDIIANKVKLINELNGVDDAISS